MRLEQINRLSERERGQVKEALSYRHCNPIRERADLPYLKYDQLKLLLKPQFLLLVLESKEDSHQICILQLIKSHLKELIMV